LFLLLGFAAVVVSGQTDPDKITEAEKREVNLIAHRFTDRMIKEKDIGRLLDEFFVPGFINRSLKNNSDDWTIGMKRDFARRLKWQDRRRYFVAENNYVFLLRLYASSWFAEGPDVRKPLRDVFPPDVIRLVENFDRRLARAMLDEGDDYYYDFEKIYFTPKRFPSYLRFLEGANARLRKHAHRIRAGETAEWKTSVKNYHDTVVELFDPSASTCDDDCYGLPKGTRFYHVEIPVLHLRLVRHSGKIKMFFANMYID
jgi:hypothetical protein